MYIYTKYNTYNAYIIHITYNRYIYIHKHIIYIIYIYIYIYIVYITYVIYIRAIFIYVSTLMKSSEKLLCLIFVAYFHLKFQHKYAYIRIYT